MPPLSSSSSSKIHVPACVEEQRRLNLDREQVLARLWEIANLSPEMTRGSITGQVKALSMIVAIEGLIPDRRAVPAQNKTAPPPVTAQIYQAAWLAGQQGETAQPQRGPELAQEEDDPSRRAVEPARPASRVPWSAPWKPAPGLAEDVPPTPGPVFDPGESAFANRFQALGETPSAPPAPAFASAPDKRVPSSIEKNPSTWRLRL